MTRVLLIAGGDVFPEIVADRLRERGFVVTAVGEPDEYQRVLLNERFDIVITTNVHIAASAMLTITSQVSEFQPQARIIAVSGHAPPEFVAKTIINGAIRFVPLHFTNGDDLVDELVKVMNGE
ncbi:MAG: hypothetical protein ABI623_09805 [bacterium]